MFKKVPLNNYSKAKRKPVLGVGTNDSDYMTIYKENGKSYRCPFYIKWRDMLSRCYSEKLHELRPTYKGCTVCKEWLTFSCFKKWMEKQEWQGCNLDKDLLVVGNKVYSPETCLFVSDKVNGVIHENKKTRGDYPLGVSFHKASGKYVANSRFDGVTEYLGVFDNAIDAEIAYLNRKVEIIDVLSGEQKNKIVKLALNEKAKEHKLKVEGLNSGK